jgi:hypothetical protein
MPFAWAFWKMIGGKVMACKYCGPDEKTCRMCESVLINVAVHPLSLRDWFAGMALSGLFSNTHLIHERVGNFAIRAYAVADAMMEKRMEGQR